MIRQMVFIHHLRQKWNIYEVEAREKDVKQQKSHQLQTESHKLEDMKFPHHLHPSTRRFDGVSPENKYNGWELRETGKIIKQS